jgi:hypothetical protein
MHYHLCNEVLACYHACNMPQREPQQLAFSAVNNDRLLHAKLVCNAPAVMHQRGTLLTEATIAGWRHPGSTSEHNQHNTMLLYCSG